MTAAVPVPDFRTDRSPRSRSRPACSIAHGPSTQTFPMMKTAGAASRATNKQKKKSFLPSLAAGVYVSVRREVHVELSRSIQSFRGRTPAVLYNCPDGTDARATGPGNASGLSKALHCMLLVTREGTLAGDRLETGAYIVSRLCTFHHFS